MLAESRYKSARAGEVVLALRARLADAGLPADVVELVPAGFIPRTTSGKLRRGAARDLWRTPSRAQRAAPPGAKRSSHARCRRLASATKGDHAIAVRTTAFTMFIGNRSGRTTSRNRTTRSSSVSFHTSCS